MTTKKIYTYTKLATDEEKQDKLTVVNYDNYIELTINGTTYKLQKYTS